MSSQSNLDNLVHEYKGNTLNEFEKAEYEERIYLQATLDKVRQAGEDRFVFLQRLLGANKYETINRQALFSRGDRVKPLWDRVLLQYMPVTSAVSLSRQAQTISYNEHITYEEALARVLTEYDSKPGLSALRSGKIVKRSAPNRKKSQAPKPVKAKKASKTTLALPAPAATVAPVEIPQEALVAKSPRDSWRVIRQVTENMLKDRMAGCDPVFVETMLRDFRVDLDSLIESYQSRIGRIGATRRGETLLPTSSNYKEEINDACRELSLDEIETVGDVLDIIHARKNAKSFLAKFHPDKNPGKEALFDPKFKAVQKALATLETYNEEHGVQANAGNVN